MCHRSKFRRLQAGLPGLLLWLCGAAFGLQAAYAASRPPAPPGLPGPPPASQPCAGLTSGQGVVPMVERAKPGLGRPYKSVYGATVERITDVKAWNGGQNGVIAPMYSTVPAWNSNETYLVLYQTKGFAKGSNVPARYLLFNGMNYQFIRDLPITTADVEDVYWSPVDPDIFYYITDYGVPNGNWGPVLAQYSVSRNSSKVLHRFDGPPVALNQKVDFGHILYLSWNNADKQLIVGIRAQAGYPHLFAASYNITTGQAGPWKKYASDKDWTGLQIAPSGKLGIIGDRVVDAVSQAVVRRMNTDSGEHGDFGVLANGDDAWVSSQFGSSIFSSVPEGNVIVENLRTGQVRTIVGKATGWRYPGGGSHISALAFKNPGWVANSIVGNPSGLGLLDSTILLANIDTGQVCRVAHHHANGSDPTTHPPGGPQGYWAEPHVVISPSGTRLLFASDWGGSPDVDTYVVTLPCFRP